MKNTKKSLLLSVVSMLLCFSMLLGTSWAWFTDSVSSGSNVIKSGNLDLDVQYTLDGKTWNDLDGADDLFQKGLWEPGHTEVVALKITNKGSLALKYEASMNIIKETIGKNMDGGNIVLSEILAVSTLTFAEAGVDPLFGFNIAERSIEEAFKGENNLAYNAPVAFKAGNVLQDDKQLLPGEAHYVVVKVDMPETVGNEANHDGVNIPTIEFGVNVLATQYAYESDSFDNQYDKDATFEDLADTNVLASSTKTLSEGADSIDFALYSKGICIAKLTVPASAIADTSKPVKVTIDGIDPSEEAMVDENTQAYAYDIKVTNLKANLTGDQLVTVVVAAPNALAAMKAYHNGVLIEDAVYDEVAGTITFKTASFSPYDFTSNVKEVYNLDELREALQIEGTTAKLMSNIPVVDLTKDTGAARDIEHAYVGSKTYYNGVMINGKNVGLDLNGFNITVKCGNDPIGNSDVGALFFVGKGGSLNITNTGAVETGFIKMESSIYAVWAPFADPSYVDIYGGAFIGDSYAGDPIGTSTKPGSADGTMQNENSNRALIYAGFGGNINVYGGYFLYNNTPNDVLNRNNGAFNAKDFYEGEEPLITIHEGVYLSNKEYRQNPYRNPQTNPSFDDYSIKLADADRELYKISEVTLDEAVKIDGEDYSTWYQVTRQFKYKITFKDADGDELDTLYIWDKDPDVTVDNIDDTARGKLTGEYANDFDGWVNTASEKITTIPSTNTTDIVLYPKLAAKYTVRWVDEDGNVTHSVTTTKTTYGKLTAPSDPLSKYGDNMMKFDHWEIREKGANGKVTYTEVKSNYSITKDTTIYPYYTYNGGEGSIALKGHDDDGDGRYDRYTVEAAAGLNGSVTIPGKVNGVRVEAITDLSSDTLNGLLGGGITSVIIEDGVQEIGSDAFAGTAGLKNVTVSASVTSVGANAFSSDWGSLSQKQVTITYDGTWEQWQAICGDNWDSGLGNGSKVVCTDATYVLNETESYGYKSDHTWEDWKKQ